MRKSNHIIKNGKKIITTNRKYKTVMVDIWKSIL